MQPLPVNTGVAGEAENAAQTAFQEIYRAIMEAQVRMAHLCSISTPHPDTIQREHSTLRSLHDRCRHGLWLCLIIGQSGKGATVTSILRSLEPGIQQFPLIALLSQQHSTCTSDWSCTSDKPSLVLSISSILAKSAHPTTPSLATGLEYVHFLPQTFMSILFLCTK